MNATNYRGYAARIEFNEKDRTFIGRLTGIANNIIVYTKSVDELKSAFNLAIDNQATADNNAGSGS